MAKRIEDIAIDRSKSFRRELKKDLRDSKKTGSRNIEVSMRLFDYIENTPGMSRVLLSDRLGVSQAYLCKLINGKVNLTINTIEKYERLLAIELIPRVSYSKKQNTILTKIPAEISYSRVFFECTTSPVSGFSTNIASNESRVQIFSY